MLVAMLVALVGAAAVVGLEPTLNLSRFAYTTLGASLALCLLVVFRLGAGLHGLGRRGLVAVLIGGGLLAVTLAYAEVLRRYGAPDLVDTLLDGRRWALETLHGAPRPVQALLGVPALVWGTHMRARRRQGWWVCAFGVTAAAQVTHTFLDPSLTIARGGPDHALLRGRGRGAGRHRHPRRPAAHRLPPRPPGAHRRLRVDAAARARPHPPASLDPPSASFRVVAREQRIEILAEMVANVLSVAVEVGDAVDVGDIVVLLESMKMEIPVIAEAAGTVTAVRVADGDVVQEGDPLVELTGLTATRCLVGCAGIAPGGVPEWPIGTALKAVAGRDVSRGFESRPLC